MSIESQTRARQAFAKALRKYLNELVYLSVEELEIARARVADFSVGLEGQRNKPLHIQRGKVLHSVVEAALRGEFPTEKFGRKFFERRVLDYAANKKGKADHASAVEEYQSHKADYPEVVKAWRMRKKGFPWYRKILLGFPPLMPKVIKPEYLFVKDAKILLKLHGDKSELVIDFAATFPLSAPVVAGSSDDQACINSVLSESNYR